MSGFESGLAGHYSMSGTFVLLIWTGGVVSALAIVIGVLALREFAMRDAVAVLTRTALVLIIVAIGWTWFDQTQLHEQSAERRALDARSTELTARAIAPGSALACLTAGDTALENACERALFANPQAVAAALAYVDARLTLLADGLEFFSRHKNYAGELEQIQRAMEADRFGLVAHVVAGRGCTVDECAAFKLLRDSSQVQANLKERPFETKIVQYAVNWPAGAVATGSLSAPMATSTAAAETAASAPVISAPNSALGPKINYPSAASFPPVSIMAPEAGETAPSGNAAASAAKPSAERQTQAVRAPPANRTQGAAPLRLPPPPAAAQQGAPSQR
jgi:hypothetical protein